MCMSSIQVERWLGNHRAIGVFVHYIFYAIGIIY